jgi:hypothetical protein
MNKIVFYSCIVLSLFLAAARPHQEKNEWVSLFDGKSLDGWKVGNNASTFSIQEGMIVANGPVAHLFYDGDVKQHNFKNFEFKAEVMTMPGSNSGIYFHTITRKEAGQRRVTKYRSTTHIRIGEEREAFMGSRTLKKFM